MKVTKQMLKLIECGLQSPECLMEYLLILEKELEMCPSLIDEVIKLKLKYSKISTQGIEYKKDEK